MIRLVLCLSLLGCAEGAETETPPEPDRADPAEPNPHPTARPNEQPNEPQPNEREEPEPRVDPEIRRVEVRPPARRGPSSFVNDDGIRWTLKAEPSSLTMAERDSFRLTIEATNEGDANVDPERHRGHWLLHGANHMGLTLWFGNGLRSMEWSDLPPSHTVTDARTPGEQLFDAPGEYEIAYARGIGRAAIVRVVVTP